MRQQYSIGYDFDGVVTEGIVPVTGSVIITGNPPEEEPRLRAVLDKMERKNIPIVFYPEDLPNDKKERDVLVGKFKSDKIKEFGITKFFEDNPKQIEIIQKENPYVNIIYIQSKNENKSSNNEYPMSRQKVQVGNFSL